MREQHTSVRQPILLGELLAGLEALLVVALPMWILIFCVVHTIQVQASVRSIRMQLPPDVELSVWSVILDPMLLILSLLFSLVGSIVLVIVTIIGVVTWRLAAWGLSSLDTSRSRRRYEALSGDVVMEANAWDAPPAATPSAPAEGRDEADLEPEG